ncbi:hypothetical protein ACTOB_003651 [Actinoplanes oblitus]|uniref:PPE family domain-containing protein n=1 Tax=Actinoplanes oblitus TaxID=3040509 RepID=A0ABY8WSA3_9ACTN|nr:hypothetical protein [Actinoplanes oblitus]WIM99978.1 hypothetical protein ACTOB_003651 [Actinoplanes oblitus]
MSALTHGLLPPGTGIPAPVRLALNEAAAACNQAAIAVNHAFAFVVQYTNDREKLIAAAEDRTTGSDKASAWAQVTSDLELIADSFHDQALVALTRAAASYAAYASHVAAELVAGRAAPLPASAMVKPSDLITALDAYLPKIEFPPSDAPGINGQYADVEAAHHELWQVTSRQLQGENPLAYDDPAAVRAGIGEPYGISAAFPEALHHYAAVLTAALAAFSETR